jgi:hypothetical protein
MQQQLQQMRQQMHAMMAEVQRFSAENDQLKQQASSAASSSFAAAMTGTVMQMQQHIVKAMDVMAEKYAGIN